MYTDVIQQIFHFSVNNFKSFFVELCPGPTESTSRKNMYEINNLRIHNDACILNALRTVLDIPALTVFI